VTLSETVNAFFSVARPNHVLKNEGENIRTKSRRKNYFHFFSIIFRQGQKAQFSAQLARVQLHRSGIFVVPGAITGTAPEGRHIEQIKQRRRPCRSAGAKILFDHVLQRWRSYGAAVSQQAP